jgi:Domain of unknown function (DUF1842)/Domain of unknown function (DUF1843)
MSENLRTGLFPVGYVIGSGMPGAPTLHLALLVDTPSSSIVGTATITQAINPPLDFHVDAWGRFSYMALMPPSNTRILVTLEGNQGGPRSNSAISFKLYLVLNNDWQTGTASYSYFSNGVWHDIASVPVKTEREFVPLEPGPVILKTQDPHWGPAPMYAVSIQHATASGDLARMKTLAAAAKHQLDSQKEIAAALSTLKAEITRLEAGR